MRYFLYVFGGIAPSGPLGSASATHLAHYLLLGRSYKYRSNAAATAEVLKHFGHAKMSYFRIQEGAKCLDTISTTVM